MIELQDEHFWNWSAALVLISDDVLTDMMTEMTFVLIYTQDSAKHIKYRIAFDEPALKASNVLVC